MSLTYNAVLSSELIGGEDGPHDVEHFMHAGGCDECGQGLSPVDFLAGDDLCQACRDAALARADLEEE